MMTNVHSWTPLIQKFGSATDSELLLFSHMILIYYLLILPNSLNVIHLICHYFMPLFYAA